MKKRETATQEASDCKAVCVREKTDSTKEADKGAADGKSDSDSDSDSKNDSGKGVKKEPIARATPAGTLDIADEADYRKICDEIAETLSERFVSALEQRWAAIRRSSSLEEALDRLRATKESLEGLEGDESDAGNPANDRDEEAEREKELQDAYIRGKNEAIEARWEGFREKEEGDEKHVRIEKIFQRRRSIWE